MEAVCSLICVTLRHMSIEPNRFITKVEIIKETKRFTTVRFENGGGIRLSNKRLYKTEEEAKRALAHKK